MLTDYDTGAVALNDIKVQADVIALESANPSQMFKALSHRLPGFVADVKTFTASLLEQRESVAYTAFSVHDLEKTISKVNYVNLSDITVFVPPSMNVDWNKFLDAVNQSQAIADVLMSETLNPTFRWVSLLLANPENMNAQVSKVRDSGIVFHDLKDVKNTISSCYAKAGSAAEVHYGTVFKRNTDFPIAVQRVNDLNERMAKINRKEVVDMVNNITDTLDKLLIRMEQNPDVYQLSGANMSAISKLAFNVAEEIEFFSAHCVMLEVTSNAMKDTVAKIEDVVKR